MKKTILIFMLLMAGCRMVASNVNPAGPTGRSWGEGDDSRAMCMRDPYRPGCER